MFQKRHYEWLARWVKDECSTATALALCNALDREGSRFNRAKFLKAAGVYTSERDKASAL